MPQPVRVHAGDPGGAADAGDDEAGEVAVERAAVAGGQALVAADVLQVGRGSSGEQPGQGGRLPAYARWIEGGKRRARESGPVRPRH